MVKYTKGLLKGVYADIIDKVYISLSSEYFEGINKVVLFGSTARSTETNDSDIDIAVISDTLTEACLYRSKVYSKVLCIIQDIIGSESEKLCCDILPFGKNSNRREGVFLSIDEEGVILYD